MSQSIEPTISPENWGQIGYLTESQEQILKQFIDEVPNEELLSAKYTVETIEQVSLRYLRARQFDLTKAKDLLHESFKRKIDGKAEYYSKLRPEECANCDIAALKRFYPHTQRGFDRKNRPILFERNGRTDVNAVFLMTTKETLINYHWWTMETALDELFTEASTKFTDNKYTTISTCAILDFDNLGLTHCSSKMLDLVKMFIALDNVCYPETLGKMLVVNAPWIAVNTWQIVKSWLDPRTQNKIEIIGSGPESIKRLHELISPEYLPKEFGGTAPDLYYSKPNTDYISIPRNGEYVTTIEVDYNKTLFVDSYIGDGIVEIIITSTEIKESISGKSELSSISSTTGSKKWFSSKNNSSKGTVSSDVPIDEETIHEKQTIKFPENTTSSSERLLIKILPYNNTNRLYKITWKNSSKYSSRPIVYTLTVSDTEEYPDLNKLIKSYTSLDSTINNDNKLPNYNDSDNLDVNSITISDEIN